MRIVRKRRIEAEGHRILIRMELPLGASRSELVGHSDESPIDELKK
ncbi:MAG TPA: hypothetical protein VE954_22705 [Oligoflexus sp.]|nr:hypothetical protein [Oligoflexus sp.]HYX35921.1 hypothetical protein [Oligoflexus sp.]